MRCKRNESGKGEPDGKMQCQWNGKPHRIPLWQTVAGKNPTKATVVRYLHAAPDWPGSVDSSSENCYCNKEIISCYILQIMHCFYYIEVDWVINETKEVTHLIVSVNRNGMRKDSETDHLLWLFAFNHILQEIKIIHFSHAHFISQNAKTISAQFILLW